MSEAIAPSTKEHDRRLTDLVAVTVVIFTVFLAVCKVKDDNIVQTMQKAQSNIDAWAEYQAARIKLHVDENGLSTLRLLEAAGLADKALAAKQAAEYQAEEVPSALEGDPRQGRGGKEYERLNLRDDQFDISDAFVSIAIALAAVAALVDAWWLLYISWASGASGMAFGIAGFAGIGLRMEWLAALLGT